MNRKNGRQGLAESFQHAVCGILFCIRQERNFRIHIVAFLWTLRFSLFYSWTPAEYALFFLACSGVFFCELLNTAIEKTVDLVTEDYHPLAKKAKDAAAGAVLVASLAAVGVGIALFFRGDVILEILRYYQQNPVCFFLLLLLMAFGAVFALCFPYIGANSSPSESVSAHGREKLEKSK